jgi:two-component system nitrogen regulation response regulator NtrX
MVDYGWPGNVRELRNTLERMVIMTSQEVILLEDLPAAVRKGRPTNEEPWQEMDGFPTLKAAREAFEKRFIIRRLEEAEGNVSRAAELLGLERSHLYRKLRAYGIKGER